MKITALTCTGDRPECLTLLSRWMKNQIVRPDQWLIIDDGKAPFMPNMDCDYIYRKPQKNDPAQTLNINIEYALPHITGDVVLFMEDDEYYNPAYVKTMTEKIRGHEAVGICRSKYYYLPARTYYVHANQDHASLAQTGIVKGYLPKLKELLNGDPFIDLRIWQDIAGRIVHQQRRAGIPPNGVILNNGKGILFDDGLKNCLYVGMKGMPGRKGIGSGHNGIGRVDPQCSMLKAWMPRDFQTYLDLKIESRLEQRQGRRG
jgi:hypothetical protein